MSHWVYPTNYQYVQVSQDSAGANKMPVQAAPAYAQAAYSYPPQTQAVAYAAPGSYVMAPHIMRPTPHIMVSGAPPHAQMAHPMQHQPQMMQSQHPQQQAQQQSMPQQVSYQPQMHMQMQQMQPQQQQQMSQQPSMQQQQQQQQQQQPQQPQPQHHMQQVATAQGMMQPVVSASVMPSGNMQPMQAVVQAQPHHIAATPQHAQVMSVTVAPQMQMQVAGTEGAMVPAGAMGPQQGGSGAAAAQYAIMHPSISYPYSIMQTPYGPVYATSMGGPAPAQHASHAPSYPYSYQPHMMYSAYGGGSGAVGIHHGHAVSTLQLQQGPEGGFQCPLQSCNRVFRKAKTCAAHVRKDHGGKMRRERRARPSDEPEGVTYNCPWPKCERFFASYWQMHGHCARVHHGFPPGYSKDKLQADLRAPKEDADKDGEDGASASRAATNASSSPVIAQGAPAPAEPMAEDQEHDADMLDAEEEGEEEEESEEESDEDEQAGEHVETKPVVMISEQPLPATSVPFTTTTTTTPATTAAAAVAPSPQLIGGTAHIAVTQATPVSS